MKRFFLLIIVLLFLNTILLAQEKEGNDDKNKNPDGFDFKDRIHFGGGGGLNLGPRTYIEASPKAIITLTEKLYFGLGVSYIYYRENLDFTQGGGGIYSTNVYGGSTFLSFSILENIVAHAEYEALNFEYYDYTIHDYSRTWIGSPLLGGGYRQVFNNGRSYIEFLMLYNFNYSSNSPYSSPWIPRIAVYL